ncbi:hypothetical protein [Herbiconiux sp. VKM Ac-2851]|uniref:hypothetical protein n=1 Tax=Herbiconiux sp. VKM Ac-2851 TaxID=2739025 RepID=UPI00156796D8|nr:hypothetical protein [Herbiconiux sp. VKM Ac-2851]NQX37195.1 hypothetical protein [Herbiconiux sp. VKM Ac-2851]
MLTKLTGLMVAVSAFVALAGIPAVATVDGGSLTVVSPSAGEELGSRTVLFSGTGENGGIVNVLDVTGQRVPGTRNVLVEGGVWSTTGVFAADDAIEQTVTIRQVFGSTGRGEVVVSFRLPAPDPTFNFSVGTPLPGEVVPSRTVTFTGTGAEGAAVSLADGAGVTLPGTEPAIVLGRVWSVTTTYPNDASPSQTVTATQTTGGAKSGTITISFTLPVAELLPAPTITGPLNGAVITGSEIRISGTGTPGMSVFLTVLPTDHTGVVDSPPGAVGGPVNTIVVDNAGVWETTVLLYPNEYTATAILADLDTSGRVSQVLSTPSTPIGFTLLSATTPTPSASPTGGGLAATGSNPTGIGVGAIVLVLAGIGAAIVRRRTNSPAIR